LTNTAISSLSDFMNRFSIQGLVLGLIYLLSLNAVHSADIDEAEMTRLLKLRFPDINIDQVVLTPLNGVYQTRLDGRYVYLLDGGRYIMVGDLIDLEDYRNITENSRREDVVQELAAFSNQELIVYPAKKQELAVLNVFTDTSCGYCQQLHKEVKYLQEAGISVRYFPFPRGGSRGPGYSDLRKVWCASDKLKAMDIAKRTAPGALNAKPCAEGDMVDRGFELGNRLGIQGTPSLFAANGTQFKGYVPYKRLIPQLLPQ
ncbi:MAG: DsbC family protein, partial [Pseudomonadota bacterium]